MLWSLIFALCLLAAAFVLVPFYRKGNWKETDRRSLNLSLYAQRLEELERDDLAEGQYDFIKKELQQNLLGDVDRDRGDEKDQREEDDESLESSGNASLTASRYENRLAVIALAIALPLLALVFYSDWGLSWGASSDMAISQELKNISGDSEKLPFVLDKLRAQLESQPDNHEGWYLLGQSSMASGKYTQAAEAYSYLTKQYEGDPGLAAAYAEALYLGADKKVTPKVDKSLNRALELNPHELSMLEIKGIGAYQSGKPEEALKLFRRALATNPQARRSAMLNDTISRIEKTLGLKTSEGEISISVDVELASGLNLPGDSTVFVYARALEGPPMPLAITRFPASDLPASVKLTESMAMMPEMSLANFDQVEIIARISASGEAKSNPDDYQAKSRVIDAKNHSTAIRLIIKNRLGDLVTKKLETF